MSDPHLGFGYDNEIGEDTFNNLIEAIEEASKSCDIIVVAGDIFDSRSPRTSVWARAISIFARPMMAKSGVTLVGGDKEIKDIHQRTLERLPVVALYGNHDRRMEGEINAVQALENAGLFLVLHKNHLIFEKDGQRVAIHGMSSVPERFAKQNLEKWDPKPIPGCNNILFIHQSVAPHVYSPLEPPTLSVQNLPKGFDLIMDGHIHVKAESKTEDASLYVIGSTAPTQFDKGEASTEKGYYVIDTGSPLTVKFMPLISNRKFFYYDIDAGSPEGVAKQIESRLNDLIFMRNFNLPPVVKFRIHGNGNDLITNDLRALEKKYDKKAILMFRKDLESQEMNDKLEFLRNLKENKLSVEEIGLNILRKNLDESGFKAEFGYDTLFSMLSEGALDKGLALVTGEKPIIGRGTL